jgi:hypothetical protein
LIPVGSKNTKSTGLLMFFRQVDAYHNFFLRYKAKKRAILATTDLQSSSATKVFKEKGLVFR